MCIRLSLSLLVAAILFVCPPGFGGPDHDAAIAEVQRGVDLCPTGNLDGAMDIFKGVEAQFPGEMEAIGWARYWHANCLLAGWRLSEVAPLMRPVWEWVVAGEISDPTAAFLFGHQYARVLNPSNYLRSACERSLEFYTQIPNPNIQIEEKSGFLQVFLSRCFYHTREYAEAAAAGQVAWEKGEALRVSVDAETAKAKDVKPLVLAAWGRLEQAKAELHTGNLLLAQVFLAECADEYCSKMEPAYVGEVETTQQQCQLELGMNQQVRTELLEKLISTDESIDKGLWLRATFHFADEARKRGATEEAIAPMAVARTCYADFPGWGLHIDLLWRRKIRGHTPNELFIPELQKQMNEGGDLQRATIRIQLSEILAERNRGGEGLALLDEVPSLSTDPRLNLGLRVARAHCEFPGDATGEIEAYEDVLRRDGEIGGRADYIVERVRSRIRRSGGRGFVEWLESNRTYLPEELYDVWRARILLGREDGREDALQVAGDLLRESSARTREAYAIKIACLYVDGRIDEASAALSTFERETVNPDEIAYGLNDALRNVMYRTPAAGLVLAHRILSLNCSGRWKQDALLLKARTLDFLDRPEDARAVLEQLLAYPPSELVGEGMQHLADLYRFKFDEREAARDLYEEILYGPEIYESLRTNTYRRYALMEEAAGNSRGALLLCDEGLQKASHGDSWGRDWLRFERARMLWNGDQEERMLALSELTELAANSQEDSVKQRATIYVEGGGR